MSRYAAMFDRCRSRGEGAFGAFVMLGDPGPAECLATIDALVAGGADMLEVGIPFSDPVADGPVIQAAAARALSAGVRTGDCLDLLAEIRRRHPSVPLGVLTYANIVAARGIGPFCTKLAGAGTDSLLVADVPQLEAAPYAGAAKAAGLDLVLIAAPSTPYAALGRIAAMASGYTYCVARSGVTGAGVAPALDHRALFDRLSSLGAPPPVLGFGISTPDQVAMAMAEGAAGVISGSAIVDRIAKGATLEGVEAFARSLKTACARPD